MEGENGTWLLGVMAVLIFISVYPKAMTNDKVDSFFIMMFFSISSNVSQHQSLKPKPRIVYVMTLQNSWFINPTSQVVKRTRGRKLNSYPFSSQKTPQSQSGSRTNGQNPELPALKRVNIQSRSTGQRHEAKRHPCVQDIQERHFPRFKCQRLI